MPTVFPGIEIIPDFAQTVLGIDPRRFHAEVRSRYPEAEAEPAWGEVQWVDGANKVMRFRGNPMPRTVLSLQRDAEGAFRTYTYTAWQWKALPATADVSKCAEVEPVADAMDRWCAERGIRPFNHYILTHYVDGSKRIGYHHDKVQDMPDDAHIVVVKTGRTARPFSIRRKGCSEPFFHQVLAPGTAIVMSVAANLATEHSVPACEGAGPSGSIAFRTIVTTHQDRVVRQKVADRRA